jgi:Domain of unknown function (DUF5011)/Bacterial Ig-like domain (group 2)
MVIGINANGASISPDPRVARDYSQPVQFTLTAADGTKVVYTVTVKGAACVTAPPAPPSTPDTTPPVITVLGTNPLSLTLGTAYTEAGATCVDNKDPTCTVVTTGTVNTAAAGSYTITYTATDAAGNESSKTRVVSVLAAPVLINPTLSFSMPTAVNSYQSTYYQALTTNSTGSVTWVSSNPAVATVDATGLVSFVVTGTVIITANQAADTTYTAGSASYTLVDYCTAHFEDADCQ